MKIVFFGTSKFGIPILDLLAKNDLLPKLVVTSPDQPQGRGNKIKSSPVKIWAQSHNLPASDPDKLTTASLETCTGSDFFVVASYGKIIPKAILEMPKFGALNIHPSLLPKYRGPSPIQYAILNGDEETGVTIMLMDEEMDHGPILKKSTFKILDPQITYTRLENELSLLGANLLIGTIPEWISGRIKAYEQNHAEATYTKKIKNEDGHINWREQALIIERKIRAFYPSPGAYAFWQSNDLKMRLKIITALVIPKPQTIATGEVFKNNRGFAVGTQDEALEIIKMQPEGRNEMSGISFLNGHASIISAILQ